MASVKVVYKTVFNRRNQVDSNGKAHVLIEAYQNRERRYFKTGVRLMPAEWDAKRVEVKKQPQINRLLRDKIAELENFELNFSAVYNRPFRLRDFDLLEALDKAKPELPVTFTSFALEQIERDYAAGSIGKVTYGRYKRVIGLLADCLKKPVVEFSDITYTLIDDFNAHFLAVENKKINTVYKHHQVIQQYLTRAVKKGLFRVMDNPYNDFRPEKEPVEKEILLPVEIEKIENLVFTGQHEHLGFYRDAFLLAYYTLLRIGDVTRIRMTNIAQTEQGIVLQLKAQKTQKLMRLPIHQLHPTQDGPSKPERLLKQYARTDKRPLFARSHARLNEYVKDVVRLAGITKHVTFHTSRHSGITFLTTKLPTPIVQQLAQHSNIATTMGYVHISGQHITDSLEGVKW